jgi:hypothetical protein
MSLPFLNLIYAKSGETLFSPVERILDRVHFPRLLPHLRPLWGPPRQQARLSRSWHTETTTKLATLHRSEHTPMPTCTSSCILRVIRQSFGVAVMGVSFSIEIQQMAGSLRVKTADSLVCAAISWLNTPTDPNILLTGLQDNGTARTSGGAIWTHVNGGDGGYCVINWTNPNSVLSYANGHVDRSTTRGESEDSWSQDWEFAESTTGAGCNSL